LGEDRFDKPARRIILKAFSSPLFIGQQGQPPVLVILVIAMDENLIFVDDPLACQASRGVMAAPGKGAPGQMAFLGEPGGVPDIGDAFLGGKDDFGDPVALIIDAGDE
jgi:hypothetical protein